MTVTPHVRGRIRRLDDALDLLQKLRLAVAGALLEAMVAGKAIVSSATAGIPEAIADGRDGILVPPGDLDALTAALGNVLADKDRRRELGCAARMRAEKEYTVEVMTDRYLGIYNNLLATR